MVALGKRRYNGFYIERRMYVGELTGELIQMNCHMVTSRTAALMCVYGVLCALVFGISAVAMACAAYGGSTRLAWLGAAVLAVACAVCIGVAVRGAKLPKEKIIHACANGPVSLERVAAVYDIVDVDGKELTLRER